MAKLHYFNPGHEMAILDGSPHYTPIKAVQRMRHDLELLPAWYAGPEDYVLIEEESSLHFLPSLTKTFGFSFPRLIYKGNLDKGTTPFHEPIQATPWGRTPQMAFMFEQLQPERIEPPAWKEAYRSLTGRQFVTGCIDKIKKILPLAGEVSVPLFCRTEQEIEEYMKNHPPPFILKQPYSSSGRGLLWIEKEKPDHKDLAWIHGSLRKQETVSIEPALKKKGDFAMEFYSDGKGKLSYKGLSFMDNNRQGRFSGCALGTEGQLARLILQNTPLTLSDLKETEEAVTSVLQSMLGTVYEGYLGVDMFIYLNTKEEYRIHPLVEINLRYTMGLVAIEINRKHLRVTDTGRFHIEYFSRQGDALYTHRARQKKYPPTFEGNKLSSGYLSLCPVDQDTHYIAYLLL